MQLKVYSLFSNVERFSFWGISETISNLRHIYFLPLLMYGEQRWSQEAHCFIHLSGLWVEICAGFRSLKKINVTLIPWIKAGACSLRWSLLLWNFLSASSWQKVPWEEWKYFFKNPHQQWECGVNLIFTQKLTHPGFQGCNQDCHSQRKWPNRYILS